MRSSEESQSNDDNGGLRDEKDSNSTIKSAHKAVEVASCESGFDLGKYPSGWPKFVMPPPPDDVRNALQSRMVQLAPFYDFFENTGLPLLQKLLEDQGIDYTAIYLELGDSNDRLVNVCTSSYVDDVVDAISHHFLEQVPHDFRNDTFVEFAESPVQRPMDNGRGSTTTPNGSPSVIRAESFPFNYHPHDDLRPGDSVGPDRGFDDGGGGTAGPFIKVGKHTYSSTCRHLFKDPILDGDADQIPIVQHPSTMDIHHYKTKYPTCSRAQRRVGRLVAFSTEKFMPARSMTALGSDVAHGPEPKCVADWAVVDVESDGATTNSSSDTIESGTVPRGPNRLRIAPPNREPEGLLDDDVAAIYGGNPRKRTVYASGRTSGLTYGLVCPVPMIMNHGKGIKTREWFVQRYPNWPGGPSHEEWQERGMGVQGDSGAPIVDLRSSKLLGQLWGSVDHGRDSAQQHSGSQSHAAPSRVAIFSHASDIFDNMRAHPFFGGRRPTLPESVKNDGILGPLPDSDLAAAGFNSDNVSSSQGSPSGDSGGSGMKEGAEAPIQAAVPINTGAPSPSHPDANRRPAYVTNTPYTHTLMRPTHSQSPEVTVA